MSPCFGELNITRSQQLAPSNLTAAYVPLKIELVVPARDQKGTRCAIFATPRLPPQL